MMPEEKQRLLALFDHPHRWCQGAEGHDVDGAAVRYDDTAAVAWDITGALCRLFGWRRACELFAQLDRHIRGRKAAATWPGRATDIDAMAALQDFNDRVDMTFAVMREQIEAMPVWCGGARPAGSAQEI